MLQKCITVYYGTFAKIPTTSFNNKKSEGMKDEMETLSKF